MREWTIRSLGMISDNLKLIVLDYVSYMSSSFFISFVEVNEKLILSDSLCSLQSNKD